MLKKYINYARNKIRPRLSPSASEKLNNIYIADRQKANEAKLLNKNRIPITVRQLEAIIRLSEALAKMKLKTEVTGDDIDEAHYLFEISTLKSVEGAEFGYDIPETIAPQVQSMEETIKKRVCVGHQTSTRALIEEL